MDEHCTVVCPELEVFSSSSGCLDLNLERVKERREEREFRIQVERRRVVETFSFGIFFSPFAPGIFDCIWAPRRRDVTKRTIFQNYIYVYIYTCVYIVYWKIYLSLFVGSWSGLVCSMSESLSHTLYVAHLSGVCLSLQFALYVFYILKNIYHLMLLLFLRARMGDR